MKAVVFLSKFVRNDPISPNYLILQKIEESEKHLRELHMLSKNATFKFKSHYDDITQTENETELLRQRYYNMLEVVYDNTQKAR